MVVCECCPTVFTAKRRDAKYCSPKCRKRASRKSLRQAAEAEKFMLTLEGRQLLDRLSMVLPVTAGRVEAFVLENGAGCTEAAVRLVLSAYSEVRAVAS